MAIRNGRRDRALESAIAAAGGPAELARKLGVTVQAISNWRRCPPTRALAVEHASGGIVKRHQLRPDVFGKTS
jgi:DNA-binding transcriptional regulator YdaS (Cro superfamily)